MTCFRTPFIALLSLIALGCGQTSPGSEEATRPAENAKPRRTEFVPAGDFWQWRQGLVKSASANLGDLRGSYFDQNRLISEQIFMGSSAPEGAIPLISKLDDGNILVAGCRHRSCDEKSALVATPEGDMLAAGLINYRCIFDELIDRFCTRHPRLTILVKYANDRPEIIGHIQAWAKEVSVAPYPPIALEERVHIDEDRARRRRS